MHRLHLALLLLIPHVACATTARAMQADSGRVQVTIEESMGMVSGFLVQGAGRSATTDSLGVARLTLPAGRQRIAITRAGFNAANVPVTVVRDSLVVVRVTMSMANMAMDGMAMSMPEVKVSATRIERLASESPNRVELVSEMEVDEKTFMAPSGISMLLNETPGLRVQATAPGLGTGGVRILGLPGQYTVMLADGLPLYGAAASALGPLDISPVDLRGVEIVKGAASALYGGQALGGVINLVSKAPTGSKELLLNRRTMSVTDGATWLSHRLSGTTGVSLLAAGTTQGIQDIDGDGWADQARADRWSVRPRLSAVDSRGRSLFLTAGFGLDDRVGGTVDGAVAPSGGVFREALRSARADVGGTARVPLATGALAARFTIANNARERTFGSGPREDDEATTGFLELTRSFEGATRTTVLGTAVQLDRYRNDLNASFDRRWIVPGLFATTEQALGPLTIAASARVDVHPSAGVRPTERLAILAKPFEGWSLRGSVGTGWAPAIARTEETEATGLRRLISQPNLEHERMLGTMLDVSGVFARGEVLITAYRSSIGDALQLTPVDVERDGSAARYALRNADGATRVAGIEAVGVWRFRGGKFIGSYGHARGSRPDAGTFAREPMPLLPRHRVGGDLMLERPGVYRMGIEGTWYDQQPLDENPFRSSSKPYLYMMAIAARQFGRFELVANFENLLNVRQTDTDPLVRPAPGMAGRWTTDVWAPLEGFMANVAVRYRWN